VDHDHLEVEHLVPDRFGDRLLKVESSARSGPASGPATHCASGECGQ